MQILHLNSEFGVSCFLAWAVALGGHGKNKGGVAVAADGLDPQPAHLHEKALGGTLNKLLHGPDRVHCLVVRDTYA